MWFDLTKCSSSAGSSAWGKKVEFLTQSAIYIMRAIRYLLQNIQSAKIYFKK